MRQLFRAFNDRPVLASVPFFFASAVFLLAFAFDAGDRNGLVLVESAVLGDDLIPAAESEDAARSLLLVLPTSNDALLRGRPSAFYQDLPTTIPGLRPYRWQGGQYGFVRNQARTPVGRTFARVHQGIDIRPVYRDRNGEPLDTVRAVADGTVVYVNRGANASNYGRYVVVRHEWDESPVYVLMAHLATANVNPGQHVEAGEPIGRMGWTGRGINRERAHLHLEIALMLNTSYDAWHHRFFRSRNAHGIYMGRNLVGLDVSGLYLALQENPWLSFSDFVLSQPVAYRIALPGTMRLNIAERYPWMLADGVSAEDAGSPGSWVVSFTREGVPIGVDRQEPSVRQPRVLYVADEIRRNHLSTAGYLSRSADGSYQLTRAGMAHLALIATTPQHVPGWF